MPLDFPTSPATGNVYSSGGRAWVYTADGAWKVSGANSSPVAIVDGGTGANTAAVALTNLGAASNTYVDAQLTTKASVGKAIAMAIVFGG